MTGLGERLIAALVDQGYAVVVTDEDVVVLLSDKRQRHHIPRVLLDDPALEVFLQVAIAAIEVKDPRFIWPWPPQGGPRPGLN